MAGMAEKEQPMFEDRSRKIADNVVLLAVARLSMALSLPALGLVAFLFNQNLEQKFETQDQKITAQKEASQNESRVNTARIETVEKSAQAAIAQTTQVNERLISVETKQTQESAAAQQFQNATLTRLDRMQDSIVNMSNAVAALTATIQANQQLQQLQQAPRRPP
jgi:ABC-type anion transport system duplicated permease subunit